jgi:hypothetical protein
LEYISLLSDLHAIFEKALVFGSLISTAHHARALAEFVTSLTLTMTRALGILA